MESNTRLQISQTFVHLLSSKLKSKDEEVYVLPLYYNSGFNPGLCVCLDDKTEYILNNI